MKDKMPDPDIDNKILKWQLQQMLKEKRRGLAADLSDLDMQIGEIERELNDKSWKQTMQMIKEAGKKR